MSVFRGVCIGPHLKFGVFVGGIEYEAEVFVKLGFHKGNFSQYYNTVASVESYYVVFVYCDVSNRKQFFFNVDFYSFGAGDTWFAKTARDNCGMLWVSPVLPMS